MSSWDALYFRLRANFDLESSLYLSGTAPNTDAEPLHAISATAEYETGKRVLRIESTQTGKVAVVYEDIKNGGPLLRSEADLVLGADGPNSVMRKAFLEPGKADRAYAGYIAWRGVVPEQEVSEKTREVFRSNITYSILGAEAGHVIV
jgi:2-polyprenyl-6-methoxyphenol hydroxylase-like FAD-dependent oxidoreductase